VAVEEDHGGVADGISHSGQGTRKVGIVAADQQRQVPTMECVAHCSPRGGLRTLNRVEGNYSTRLVALRRWDVCVEIAALLEAKAVDRAGLA
jgi:hypothetical protein